MAFNNLQTFRFPTYFRPFTLSLRGLTLALTLLIGGHSQAFAQNTLSKSGKEAPSPKLSSPQESEHDLGQRRAIRGCTVGDSCQGPIQQALKEFEYDAFPKHSDDSPWIQKAPSTAHNTPAQSQHRLKPKTPILASTLRPDLPWLDKLKMPDIPVQWDHKIIKYLEFYRYDSRGRNIMSAWIREQGKYKDMMLKKLRKHGLPDDLIYISMIESSYSPHEYSRVGASGLWQFMPAAGHIYGLIQNRWLDERNDPERSTDAVMYYFQDLHDRFGDWDLAMAAFNAGYGAMIKSIAKYNTNDYWQIIAYENGLPWGTSHYVAKFLASAIVGHNLKTFGYHQIQQSQALETTRVTVPRSVSLAVVARAAGISKEEIQILNPQLRRGRTPPGVKNYGVQIPKGSAKKFSKTFAQLHAEEDEADAYLVKHGERFEDIAAIYGISRSTLRKLNGLSSETEVRGGMILVVPKVDEATKKANQVQAKKGLYRAGVPSSKEGQALLVPVHDLKNKIPGRVRHLYRVVSGDTLSGIAAVFKIKRQTLALWNGLMDEAHLHPRMVLQVWTPKYFKPADHSIATLDPKLVLLVQTGSESHLNQAEQRVGRKRIAYSPKKPESLESIGKQFGLGKYDLARINQKAPNTIVGPHESILVYQVVDKTASKRAAAQAKSARPKKSSKKAKAKAVPKSKAGKTDTKKKVKKKTEKKKK